MLTVYVSCHGKVLDNGQEHMLLSADVDPDDIMFTELPTAELAKVMLVQT